MNSIPPHASKECLSVGLSGNTLIPLLSGEEITLQEMATLGQGKWLYSCDVDGNIVPGHAHSVCLTSKQSKAVRIILDSGESFVCSLDHHIMMRDGTYKEAGRLQSQDSLMPLYRRLSTDKKMPGYEQVYNPATQKWRFTHRVIAHPYHADVIHHIDFNKRNNDPANLQPMTWEVHTELHRQQTQLLEGYAKSEQGRQKSRELMQAHWNDPVWREQSMHRLSENGRKVSAKLIAEGRNGLQAQDKEVVRERSRQRGLIHHHHLHTPEAQAKSQASRAKRLVEDEIFREANAARARQNLVAYNTAIQSGEIKPSEAAIQARRENARRNFSDPEKRRLAQLKVTYVRFYQQEYATFEEFLQGWEKKRNNHKVIAIEDAGYEDVYALTVDRHFNFALSVGIFAHITVSY